MSFFEILTQRYPYDESGFTGWLNAHIHKAPFRLRDFIKNIPQWLDDLLWKMLEKRPENRVSLEAIQIIVENNRPENIEKAMERGQQLVLELFRGGINNIKQDLEDLLVDLQNRLAGASQGLQQRLSDFILKTKSDIQTIEEREQQKSLLHGRGGGFNPLVCPNLACNELLSDALECPSCQTAWQMKCCCSREQTTRYNRDCCQKCLERTEIPLTHKQRYSLLTSVAQCLKEKSYATAMSYFGFFPELQQDRGVMAQYQEIKRLYEQQKQAQHQELKSSVEQSIQELLQQKNQEDAARHKIEDWYDEGYYKGSVTGVMKDPLGPNNGSNRCQRGGCWNNNAEDLRAAHRVRSSPDYSYNYIGLRAATILEKF